MQTNYNYLQAEDKVIDQATYVRCGSIASLWAAAGHFRLSAKSGSTADIVALLVWPVARDKAYARPALDFAPAPI
jgi:hypothetical protein